MIKEVKWKGYTEVPSDYECSDGELAMSLNAIYEDGALRHVMQPKTVMQLPESETVLCKHELPTQTNYIAVRNDYSYSPLLLYYNDEYESSNIYNMTGKEIYQITPVGNTLVVCTSDGIYYFLWSGDGYVVLGNSLPKLDVNPYISTVLMNTTSLATMFGESAMETGGSTISGEGMISSNEISNLVAGTNNLYTLYGEVRQNVYEKVFAIVNRQSATLKRHGYFFEPFYVRFAYRMYDGSHVSHTVPVLLVPTTWGKPLMSVSVNTNNNTAIFNPVYSAAKLMAQITLPAGIDNWKDIITDIDVFVTEPLIDYTDNVESLVSLSKIPWIGDYYRDYIMPKAMTVLDDKKKKWINVPDYIEQLNKQGFYIMRGGNMDFTDGVYRGNLNATLSAHRNEYMAFDTSAYQLNNAVYNDSGQQVATLVDDSSLTWLSGKLPMELTLLRLDDNLPDILMFTLENDINATIPLYFISTELSNIDSEFYIDTKRVDGKDYKEVLEDYSSFYKVAELNIAEMASSSYDDVIPIKEGTLQNISVRQVLPDLGQGHNKAITSNAFSYNNRLNIILDQEVVKDACTSLMKQNPAISDNALIQGRKVVKAYVEIYENSQYAYCEIPVEDMMIEDLFVFAFPHNQARNLVVYTEDYVTDSKFLTLTFPLKRHEFMNLSYAFNDFDPLLDNVSEPGWIEIPDGADPDEYLTIPSNDTIIHGNVVRLSDVNNPFRFSEEYNVSLPVSKIYALSTAAKALSQGQFGQYPLYAFTSDGIWALELTATGTYSARQPISRDVVLNKDSITQIDTAVLFATDRGIMLVSGSNVTCISDMINSADPFSISTLNRVDELMVLYNAIEESSTNTIPSNPGDPIRGDGLTKKDLVIDFRAFIKDCRMIYDYTHQHIIVYNNTYKYAYVYSLKSQQWGMMRSDIMLNVNSYPEALAMTSDKRLVDFSQSTTDVPTILVVTRPMKLDAPDVHKTMSAIIQRGNMNNKSIAQVLYGSNDLQTWAVVWTSNSRDMLGLRGTPYKYYRMAMTRKLQGSESLHGISVQYEPRLTNRLR